MIYISRQLKKYSFSIITIIFASLLTLSLSLTPSIYGQENNTDNATYSDEIRPNILVIVADDFGFSDFSNLIL